DWEVYHDEQTKQPYFFNRRSSVSTWDPPSSMSAITGVSPLVKEGGKHNDFAYSTGIGAEVEVDTKGKEEVDPPSLELESSVSPGEEGNHVAGKDWEALVDPGGHTYYHNKVTRESTWTPPGGDSLTAVAAAKAATAFIAEATPFESHGDHHAVAAKNDFKERESGGTGQIDEDGHYHSEGSVSEKWEAVLDEVTGQTFFYNSTTGASSWE
ncbi:unnamed protein product, partial [Discosporangium mesarthrocarpum]